MNNMEELISVLKARRDNLTANMDIATMEISKMRATIDELNWFIKQCENLSAKAKGV